MGPNADNSAYVDWGLQEKLLVRQDRELTAPGVVTDHLGSGLYGHNRLSGRPVPRSLLW